MDWWSFWVGATVGAVLTALGVFGYCLAAVGKSNDCLPPPD